MPGPCASTSNDPMSRPRSSTLMSRGPSTAALIVALLALSGCGGGGGGGSSAPAPASSTPGTTSSGTPAPAAAPAPSAAIPADGKISVGSGCTAQYTVTALPVSSGTDPLLGQQWHLKNTGQNGATAGEDLRAFDAWASNRGEGARIAVIDESIEVTHPDLRPNLVDGGSRSYRAGNPYPAWPLPCDVSSTHGTSVAGIALGRSDNASGGAGVAPKAAMVAFDALASDVDVDIADALTRDAALNFVYHNSWGAPDDGALHPADAAFRAAIDQGVRTGRGGRGSIYVFSAGNGGCFAPARLGGCQQDNSNYDGYVNQRPVIAVCAVDDSGKRPSYGEPGANLTVCAPSSGGRNGITTTTTASGYRSDFSGTSASAPMVSGVAGLMLTANPALTWRDVRLILARTARRNDAADAGWSPSAAGPAAAFNHKYGFGVVDANAAVAAAKTWTSVGGSDTLRSCTASATPNRALPDASATDTGTAVTDTLTITGCAITKIEFVEVKLTAPHAYSGDLRVRLLSPTATESRLAERRGCSGGCGSYADWSFGSMRHLDEPATGAWSLEVTDLAPQDTGTLQSWSLTIHGR